MMNRAAAKQALSELAQCFDGIDLDAIADKTAPAQGLTDLERVRVGLQFCLSANDPNTCNALLIAAKRITEHRDILMREAFEGGI